MVIEWYPRADSREILSGGFTFIAPMNATLGVTH
jgi:hypothetical protein